MQTYFTNKLVQATPMSKQDFSRHNGWVVPIHDVIEDAAGFLVEDPKGISNHKDHKGRIHWLSYPEFLVDHVSLGDISDSPEYQQRMVGELAQLNIRLADLQKYLKSDRFLKLDFIDRDLLQEQCRMMARYSGVLTDRLLRCGF